MELIKEIRDLSAEITALKDSVKKYDSEISQANVSAAKMAKMFDGYKGAKASAMSMEELEKATRKLIDGYNELEKAQNQYAQRQQALLNLQSRLKEQQNILPQAQRQALSNGDQAGAERLYQQYMSNAQALAQVEVEIRNAQSSMSTFNGVMTESATIANRYEGVLAAMRDAQGNINIDQLNAALREEKNNLADLSNQMREYIIYIKETQEKIKNGKIAPEDVEEKTAELEGMRNKVAELKNEYTAAAERARVFARAAGQDQNKISLTPQNLPSMQPKGVKFPEVDKNLKAAADATKGVNTGLDDMIKKGLRFAGLSFGAGQLLNFGRQVMSVRGEFQQLEVEFTTLLGSEQKAQKLMQQLTKTAATTPFDLQSVSRGAKQLLAYGTAAEDVNDILVHLGDIAAGLSQPLDALVYLYGTTMVQGKMMTMDLRQFQNRGIPIAEQLAKQFGVAKSEVQGLVSSGRVTAEEFHKAIMAMSSDGGKFGGLMAAQSKTISGQISNIQDSISMMFNEIGKKSEGGINAMLSGVSTLVENYETVGKVLLSLVATYGVYKAALIAVAAIEKARAATAMYNLMSDSASISTTKFLTKAIWGRVKAQLASNAAMLANPAVLVTAGIVAMGVAIWGVCKALDAQGRAQNKVNKLNNETKKAIEGTKSDADAAISTIQSETATAYEKAAAYEKLKQIMPSLTEQYTLQQIATMDVTEAQKAEAQAIEDLTFKMKENQITAAKQKLTTLEQSRDFAMAQGQPTFGYNADIKAQEATIAKLQKELDEMKRLKEQAEFDLQPKEVKIAKFVSDKEGFEAKLAELQQQADTLVAAAREKFEKNGEYLNKMLYGTNDFDVAVGNNPTAVVGAEYTQIISNIKTLQGQIKSTQSQIEALNGGVSSNITQTVNEIIAAENTLEAARKKYAADMSEQNKKDLETAESNLKTKTDLYQKATGQQWQATKELSKKILQEEENLARERESIQSRETSKRHQATTQYNNKLADISKEEKEWKEQNPNRELPSYFKTKREVAYLEYTTNLKQLDEEFNDWIEGIQRETGNIDFSNYLNDLQLEIDIEPSYEIRKEKIDKQREAELRKVKEDGNRSKTEQLKEQFGDKSIELYNKLQEDGANREELLKGYAKDLHTDVTILEQVMQQIDSASNALDAQTAAQVSAKRRGFENEDIQGVYSEYYAIGEGLANYAGYELKKKAIADKYNELRGKAELVKDKGTKEKMLATFSDMQDKELKQLENNFFMSLTTTNADGSEMSIAERLMGKNGNVKLIETVRLLKLLKKAKQEIDGSNDKKVSSETSNAITDLTGLSADEIESLAANSNDMAVAWEGVRDAISSSVTELSNINTGNQGIDKVLLGISQAAEIATDETAGLSDKINSSVNIIFNTLSGAFQMVAETMSMIGEASHNEEIMETAEVFSGIAQNFSAAGQGAATGGWIGAIVGGVTDALGQIINAVVQNTSAAHEAKVAYQQWADAAREVSYSQSMQSKNNIFGENNVDKLTTALDTLRKVKDDYLETIKGLEEASQKDAEELKNLLSAKNQLIASITIASLSVVGLLNGNIWQNWEKNKQALDEYKNSLYEVLVGGFYKNGKQNIDGFVKAVENGYSALEAMQIKTLDKSGSSKDEYKALKDLAPEVFNEDGSIDTEMLDAFMQAYGDKLTEEQRMLLERLKVQQDAYNEAFEQATEYYTNLFGNVGTSLMDAFESEMVRGEDALDNFTDSIADAVEEWVRQFAYMAYIQPYLMDATKMIEDAVSAEGATTESINAAMDEALAYIFGNFNEMQDGYTAFLQDAQGKYGDMFGMDLFQDADAEGSQGFGQMTQDQADTLTARFTAVQMEMANVSATTQAMAGVVSLVGEDIKLGVAGIQSLLYNSNIALQMAQDQLDQMQIIADNTAMLAETNTRLKAIEQNTGRL